MKKFVFALPIVVAAVASTYLLDTPSAEAQSGSRTYSAEAQRPFAARFWDYLQNAKYTNWAPAPEQNGDFYEGSSPHGAFLKMYLNRTAAANAKDLPHGSVVVKENYGDDKRTLMAITVMYRAKGYNLEAGDWYWVKFNPNGTVATAPADQGGRQLAGKVSGCISCHSGADGGDLAFLND